ncbi:flagellar basal body P-ring formation chaperone FlgA [Marinobacter fonticola]|uniref:flagellar basal body P-ring formation chaperone FlgA n=1 Tax=Marinobacter fonticola TaxID=2603215 RepID=UPI0011E89479|nr:flagellar basal body P-ring formation chaperone FlgA [Marinobacter fonticola]
MRIIILLLLAGLALNSSLQAAEKTTSEDLRHAAKAFLTDFAEQKKNEGYAVKHSLGTIDSRLNLAPCPAGPAVKFSSNPLETTQPTLELSCSGKRPWRLFLSTSVEIRGEGLVAAQPLSRGDRVTADMIDSHPIVINSVRRGAVTDRKNLIGMELRRSVNAGTIFTPDIVIKPDAVARGDHVIIVARSGPIAVESRGKALANGRIGEQVLVQNLRSERTLRAMVTAPGRVEVPM